MSCPMCREEVSEGEKEKGGGGREGGGGGLNEEERERGIDY